MNLLFIGKRHFTNRDALAERYGRIYQLPLHWSQQGASTHLWLIDYHGKSRAKRLDGALTVDSTPIRRLSWVSKAFGLIWRRLTGTAPTHIIASGDAYIGLLGWLLARLTGACFVFDVYDKYDEFGAYRKPLGWDLFGFLIRHADQCWFASRRLLGQLGNAARGDALVMNGVDTERFKPMDKLTQRRRLHLSETGFLVGYFGALNQERGLPDLIKAIGILRRDGLDVGLVLAGKADPDIPLNESGILYLGNIAHEEVPALLAAVDVVAVPYRNSAFLDAASSIKFGEIMACQRPLVATLTPNFLDNFPEQAQILKPYLAEPGNPAALALAIQMQLEDQVAVEPPLVMTWAQIAASRFSAIQTIHSAGQ
jgi:glycosyltransferase involved in cell wall biosynthesis